MARGSIYVSPKGGRLSALEQNILKYRALQMVLVLFHAESLRDYIVQHIKYGDKVRKRLGKPLLISNEKKEFEQALKGFVTLKLIDQNERNEIINLMDHRNDIAHRVHELTADIEPDWQMRSYAKFKNRKYNYNAVKRLKFYLDELPDRNWKANQIGVIGLRDFAFLAADKTYENELKRLRRKIDQQSSRESAKRNVLRKELDLTGTELVGDFYPNHPYNKTKDGRLTKRGKETCFRLFDLGRSPLAVAYLMHMTYRSMVNRNKDWEHAGGINRIRAELVPSGLSFSTKPQ